MPNIPPSTPPGINLTAPKACPIRTACAVVPIKSASTSPEATSIPCIIFSTIPKVIASSAK